MMYQVFSILRESFNDSSWTIDAFYHELNENNFAKYFVVIFQEEIIGYLGLWIVIDQAQITTIAIKRIIQRLWIRSAIT